MHFFLKKMLNLSKRAKNDSKKMKDVAVSLFGK